VSSIFFVEATVGFRLSKAKAFVISALAASITGLNQCHKTLKIVFKKKFFWQILEICLFIKLRASKPAIFIAIKNFYCEKQFFRL